MKKSISIILLLLVLLFAAYDRYCITGELKEFKRHTITVGDTTLQIIRDLKIQNETKEILDIRRINPGKNVYYVELNSKTGVDIIVMKY